MTEVDFTLVQWPLLRSERSCTELVVVVIATTLAPPAFPRGGGGSGTGPFPRQKGVYTHIAHEGAPGCGGGPNSLRGGGGMPGRWQGALFRSGALAGTKVL